MKTYAEHTLWRELQAFLPPAFRIEPGMEPTEECWHWRGHQVHLDTYRQPASPVKLILFHGVGTQGRQLNLVLGAPLARRGYETIAIDMPEYGMTTEARGARVRYDDWVQAGSDLIDAELARDARPIVLYGLSAGGMLSYHVAARSRRVQGIVGMTFLDNSRQAVRDATARNLFMSRVGGALVRLGARSPLAGLRMPMPWVSKMHALVNDPAALKLWLRDKRSAGNAMTLAFLASYLDYRPALAPEDFDVCPILLTQPAQDRWTPLALSQPFLRRVRQVPVQTLLLDGAGHYPLEQPGLTQLVDAVEAFCQRVIARG